MTDADDNRPTIRVSLADQRLRVMRGEAILAEYAVSTGRRGAGERNGSGGTPRGWHCIRAKIGAGCDENTVFVGRRPTGEIYSATLGRQAPDRDWILTRILWLSGLEPGVNRLGAVDTMRRYIYIHGCPDNEPMGVAASHGCIRMRNREVMALFDQVPVGCRVWIQEAGFDQADAQA